jgi:hypothetical protein
VLCSCPETPHLNVLDAGAKRLAVLSLSPPPPLVSPSRREDHFDVVWLLPHHNSSLTGAYYTTATCLLPISSCLLGFFSAADEPSPFPLLSKTLHWPTWLPPLCPSQERLPGSELCPRGPAPCPAMTALLWPCLCRRGPVPRGRCGRRRR